MNSSDRSRLRTVLRLSVTVVLIAVLISLCDWGKFAELAKGAEIFWLGVSIACLVVYFVLGWLSLALLCLPKDKRSSWWRGLGDYGLVQAFALLTPGRAGELSLPLALRSLDVDVGEVSAAIVVQRLVTVVVLSGLALAAGGWIYAPVAWIGFGFAALIWLAITFFAKRMPTLKPGRGGFTSRLIKFVEETRKGWRTILTDRQVELAAHTLLMILRTLVNAGVGYAVILALGLSMPLVAWLGIVAVGSLVAIIPITIMGLGIVEGIYVLAFKGLGETYEAGLAVSLIARMLTILTLLVWAGVSTAISLVRTRSAEVSTTATVDPPRRPTSQEDS